MLPLGTANDLARNLGIPEDPKAAADVIVAGVLRTIDVGSVNGHPFFNVASIGLSVDLARSLTPEVKRRWGRLGYAVTAMQVLARARRFSARISEGGETTLVRSMQIAVGNGRHYGGGNVVEETAAIDDGHLDLYSLEMRDVWKLAFGLRTFRSGMHGAWTDVRTARGVEFEIATRYPREVNADGEIVTERRRASSSIRRRSPSSRCPRPRTSRAGRSRRTAASRSPRSAGSNATKASHCRGSVRRTDAMSRRPSIAREISYASSASTRAGRAVIRSVENLTGRLKLIRMARRLRPRGGGRARLLGR